MYLVSLMKMISDFEKVSHFFPVLFIKHHTAASTVRPSVFRAPPPFASPQRLFAIQPCKSEMQANAFKANYRHARRKKEEPSVHVSILSLTARDAVAEV